MNISTGTANRRFPRLRRLMSAGRSRGSAGDTPSQLPHAVERGLREKFPGPQGELLATAVGYLPRHAFEQRLVHHLRDQDSAVTLYTLFTGKADGTTMKRIRAAMIGSALLGDVDAVGQWAQAGLTRCRQVGGKWPVSAPEWKWVLSNLECYVESVQDLARSLNPE